MARLKQVKPHFIERIADYQDPATFGWYVILQDSFDEQAANTLELKLKVNKPLPEKEARKIQSQIEEQANLLRQAARRITNPPKGLQQK